MSTRLASWSQQADPRRAVVAATIALALFVGAWAVLHTGFYTHDQIVDTPSYQTYGDAMSNGKVPYRDFGLEYPPGALPVFVVPSLLRSPEGDLGGYRTRFEAEMLVCGGLALLFVLSSLLSLDASPLRMGLVLGFTALAPLLIGSVILSRFDLWPAALTVGVLAALLAGRDRLAAGVLGLAVAAKIYPVVALPLLAVWVWRRSGRRAALIALGIFAGVVGACFLPFFALSPYGMWDSITRQTNRPLQIESLGSSLLLVLHQIAGVGVTMESSHGSQNLAGGGPNALAAVQSVLQILSVAAVWAWFTRGPMDRDRLVRAFAAAVCAFIAFSKVFSPQFMIWLIPLVPLVRGRRGVLASGVLALALVLTQMWFPFNYWDLVAFDAYPSSLVFVRDLVMLGLLAALLVPTRRARPAAAR
jgi:glycosyl transferase family 87